MSVPADLLIAYEATKLDLPPVEANRPRFVLTAQRPFGDPLTPAENDRRHRALGDHLSRSRIAAVEVAAHDPDGTVEQCWGVTCTRAQVIRLCRLFEQHGYFEVTLAAHHFVKV